MPTDDSSPCRIRTHEARLYDFKRRLLDRGLRFPACEGAPMVVDQRAIAKLIKVGVFTFSLRQGAPNADLVLLRTLVDEIGLMPAEAFRDALRTDPDIAVPKFEPDETAVKLAIFLERTRTHDIAMPHRKGKPDEPWFARIAQAAGIDAMRLTSARSGHRAALMRYVADAGLVDHETFVAAIAAAGLDEPKKAAPGNIDDLRRHLRVEYIGKKRPLPEAQKAPGAPAYGKLCRAAGVPYRGRTAEPEIVREVNAAMRIVGIASDAFKPNVPTDQLTYGILLAEGVARRRLEEPGVAPQTLERFASALRTIMKHHGKTEGDAIAEDFGHDFEAAHLACADTFSKEATGRRWSANVMQWRAFAHAYDAPVGEDLPGTLAGAIKAIVRRQKHGSVAAMLRAVDMTGELTRVTSWANGTREPVRGDDGVLARLEARLGLAPKTFTSRVRIYFHPSKRSGVEATWPASLDTEELRKLARPILPTNWNILSAEERELIGASIRREAQTQIAYRQRQKSITNWRIADMPVRVSAAWDRIIRYKTDAFPEYPRVTSWSPRGTPNRNWGIMHQFFSVMALPRESGGLGIPVEQLTFALLACPITFETYAKWQLFRGEGTLNSGTRVWCGLLGHLTTAATQTKGRKKTGVPGFLHFCPELADELEVIPGVVTAEDIARLRTPEGWEAALAGYSTNVWKFFREWEGKLRPSRDSFEPIQPILELDKPFDVIDDMLASASHDLPDRRVVTEYERAIAVRRFVTVLLVIETALRRRNVATLTWRADNKGQLREIADSYAIVLSVDEFKNKDSSLFTMQERLGRGRSTYTNRLITKYGDVIREYIEVARPFLLSGRKTDRLFVNRCGEPISEDQLYDDFATYTWKYLVYHEHLGTGIKGVETFGPTRSVMSS